MFGLTDVSLDLLSKTPVLIGLAALLLLCMTIWVYMRTNPPLPRAWAILLGLLRGIAILALIGALLEPIIGYQQTAERLPRISFLLDASASMDRVEDGKPRSARLDSLLSSTTVANIAGSVALHRQFFADKVDANRSSLNREQTALGEAIRQLLTADPEAPPDQIVLFTDGNSNSGRRPLDVVNPHIPIHTVDLALSSGSFDIALEQVDFNPVVFVGQQTEIKATLSWRGAAGQSIRLELFDKSTLLSSENYAITQDGGLVDLTLNYTPLVPGQLLLRLHVPGLPAEESDANNQRTISVRVLKSKLAVLLYADRPDLDVSFLQRAIRASNKYDLTLAVLGAGNLSKPFPATQAELNRYDLILLADPNPNKLSAQAGLLKSYLSDRGGGVWVLMGEQFASAGPSQWLAPLLPFSPSTKRPIQPIELHAEPVESQLFHPAIRLADDRASIRDIWTQQPPFRSLVVCDRVTARSTILATVTLPGDSAALPALGFRKEGAGKLFATSVAPWWQWKLVQSGLGQDNNQFNLLVEGIASWLTVPEDASPITISPEKEIFTRGEPIRFQAAAFDAGLRPIEGAGGEIRLTAAGENSPLVVDLLDRKLGKYNAEFSGLPPGTYTWEGSLEREGALLKRASGTIHVEPFSLEEARQGGDPATLSALASASGGRYVRAAEFDQLSELIPNDLIPVQASGEFRLWGESWLLYLCLGALALEWVIRKSRQLL